MRKNLRRPLLNALGLLGPVALLSYAAAVVFSPLADPGYNWMAQAVSDLSAAGAPSRALWSRLAAPYDLCAPLVPLLACVSLSQTRRGNRPLRLGVGLFAAMSWVSALGYGMFPLTEAGAPSGFQNAMHLAVTALVVLLSIASLALLLAGGLKGRAYPALSACAGAALALMLAGAIGVNLAPAAYFGVFERFSVFAAAGFTAALGMALYRGRL